MASYFLPSFLTGWELPTISAFSLSANLQRRILSYLLKKTLGHLVAGGQLHVDQIDAGIGSGKIEIRHVRLDADAINRHLPDLPLAFDSGEIGKISVQLPVPNFWSGDLVVTVANINVKLKVLERKQTDEDGQFPQPSLSASFASAASQIFEDDEEAHELQNSIHQSLAEDDLAPDAQNPNDVEATSVVSSYVEALLARLKLHLQDVKIDLVSDQVDLSLHLESADVQSSNAKSELNTDEHSSEAAAIRPSRTISETVRSVELRGLQLWLDDHNGLSSSPATQQKQSSQEAENVGDISDEDDAEDDAEVLEASQMSQSSASLYESAIDETRPPERTSSASSQIPPITTTDIRPELRSSASIGGMRRLLSTGTEPIKISFTTIKEREDVSLSSTSRRPPQRLLSVRSMIDVGIGNVAAMVFVNQLPPLVALCQIMASRTPSSSPIPAEKQDPKPVRKAPINTSVEATCSIKSFHFILAYEDSFPAGAQQPSIDAFWARPARSHPDLGHLRLRADSFQVKYVQRRLFSSTSSTPTSTSSGDDYMSIIVSDVGIFEHLSPSIACHLPEDLPRILPILILDPNLSQQYDVQTPGSKFNQRTRRDTSTPTIDTLDWRLGSGMSTANAQTSPASAPSSSPRTARFQTSDHRTDSPISNTNLYGRTAYGERSWKLRSRLRPHSSLHVDDSDPTSPAIIFRRDRAASGGRKRISVSLAPIHIFLDISIVTRLLPALKKAAAEIANSQEASNSYDLTASTATLSASIATVQASPQTFLMDLAEDERRRETSATLFELKTDLIRTEIRTPQISYSEKELAGRDLRTARLLGLDRRSGLLLLEIKSLDLRFGLTEKDNRHRGVHFAESTPFHEQLEDCGIVTGRVTAEKVAAYLAAPSESKATQLATMEAMRDDETVEHFFPRTSQKLQPRMIISNGGGRASTQRDADSHKDQYSCMIPAVIVELSKEPIDSLQYMVDDLTQWISFWSSDRMDGSDSSDNEALRMLGSRFFGSRAGQSVLSTSTESTSTARNGSNKSAFGAGITEISIRLRLPQLVSQPASISSGADARTNCLLLTALDTQLLFESDKNQNTSRIDARVSTVSLAIEEKESEAKVVTSPILSRTMDSSLSHASRPMVSIGVEAYSEPGTSYREQSLEVILSYLTLCPPFDEELLKQIKQLFKTPEGVFENVEPNEVTRISFKARDCSILVAPPQTQHRAALAVGEASIKTKLTSHAPKTAIKLALASVNLFAIDQQPEESQGSRRGPRSASEYWHSQGFSKIVSVSECKGGVSINKLTRPEIDFKITKLRTKMQACADTLQVLAGLASTLDSLPTSKPGQSLHSSDRSPTSSDSEDGSGPIRRRSFSVASSSFASPESQRMTSLMASIDEDAFRLAEPMSSVPDLMEDDVPTDPNFLGATGRYHPKIVETALEGDEFFGGDSVASLSLAAPSSDKVVYADEDVTIRILDPNGIHPVEEYFTDPNLRPRTESLLGASASSVRVRVTDFDFAFRLHSGYDWASTRKTLEDEAKSVRKRLQKIKQLLDEGQVPDDSVEAATCNLLDSVHITLPHDVSEMGPAEMLRAVDDELGDGSETGSTTTSQGTATTWQTLPSLSTQDRANHDKSSSIRARKSKLHRSPRCVIEFVFRGLAIEFDQLDASDPSHIASRVAVSANKFEIIDHVETSTWHAFLTEMMDQDSAYRKYEEKRMIMVEMLNVRSEAGAKAAAAGKDASEVRVRAKIAPLRLHVDQDALDFLKKFFAFKKPGGSDSELPGERTKEPTGPPLPFIQFAEILPIKLKLDYKPKRVDYNLLRQGKTIELMNFFHFEGAEMVLRHITLRGINGWTRLFDSLNDIWTPDVKANQLADVLSGMGPVRSLVNVGAGLADLVLLPIEQYNKDGRLLRGMQKAATVFAKSTALEAVKLGARLATGTQVILEQAEHILGGQLPESITASAVGPEGRNDSFASLSESMMFSSSSFGSDDEAADGGTKTATFSRYASQPENMQEALNQAYSGFSKGLTSAAQTILAIPMEVYEPHDASANNSGVAAGRPVVRAVPIAVLRGARGATEAIAKTMQGVQVSLGDTDAIKEGKYKQDRSTKSGRRTARR